MPTSEDTPLIDGETVLTNTDEMLWRVCVKGNTGSEGQPTALMFRVTNTDKGKLSTSRGSRVSPDQVISQHEALNKTVVGVGRLSVSDVETVGLRAVDDSETNPNLPEGHAYIDHRKFLIPDDRDARNNMRLKLFTAMMQHGGLITKNQKN